MKKNTRIIINHVLVLLILLGIAVPVLFTTERMEFFSKEPVVETKVKMNGEDAPVLKIATDYDFCPNS